MIVIDLILSWLLLDMLVYAMVLISLEMNNTLTDCDKGYIDVRCTVDGFQTGKGFQISLMRSKKLVASALDDGVVNGTELTNRSGVTVQSSISNVSLSYLSIRIMSSVVKPTIDEGWYQCVVDGLDAKNGLISEKTSLQMLNITEIKSAIECYQSTTKIQLRKSASTVESQSRNTNTDDIGMYRELTVVTGVLICCILLLIMYHTFEATNNTQAPRYQLVCEGGIFSAHALTFELEAMVLISLEMNNTLTDCDKGYIDVRCTVDGFRQEKVLKYR